jgi:hypothetical protein
VKKNLFNINLNNSSDVHNLQTLKACEPCTSECKKISIEINKRNLADLKDREIAHILSPFSKD